MTPAEPPGALRDRVAGRLQTGRERSLSLLEPLTDADLRAQHSPLMSPLVWDLAHIGSYEELWLLREVAGRDPLRPDVDHLYDAFRHARRDRSRLPILGPAQARDYVAGVRSRVLDTLDALPADALVAGGGPSPLLAGGFVYGMVVQHEAQHDETMLATVQLRHGPPVLGAGTVLPSGRRDGPESVLVPAGPFVRGVDGADEPWSYDNERGAHVVDLPAFRIARLPVTNAQWAAFAADGGYDEPRWWSAVGWAHRREAGLAAPQFWQRDGAGGWMRTRFGRVEPVPPDEPVQHVGFHEARAYARWAGARLPTEAEWEKACAWDPAARRRRRWPWGDAPPDAYRVNLGGGALRPAPVGAYPSGASAYGVEQMLGDVWEWCDSGFEAYPGFRAFPYREYSEVFFGGDFRMLRGGSWATAADAVRPSFRNWDLPVRRQVFSGLRLAWDA